jgi:hypothetical protein
MPAQFKHYTQVLAMDALRKAKGDQSYQGAFSNLINGMFENWRRNIVEVSDNPTLTYQKPLKQKAVTELANPLQKVIYQASQAETLPVAQSDEGFTQSMYQRPGGVEQFGVITTKPLKNTLYQTRFQVRPQIFYQASAPCERKPSAAVTTSNRPLYEAPRLRQPDTPAKPLPVEPAHASAKPSKEKFSEISE